MRQVCGVEAGAFAVGVIAGGCLVALAVFMVLVIGGVL